MYSRITQIRTFPLKWHFLYLNTLRKMLKEDYLSTILWSK